MVQYGPGDMVMTLAHILLLWMSKFLHERWLDKSKIINKSHQ